MAKSRRRRFEWRRAWPLGGLISVGRHPVVIGVLCAYFLMQLAHGALPAVWAFFGAEKFGWGPGAIGTSLAFVGVTAALVQGGLTCVVIPKIGQRRAVYLGLFTMTASFLGYAFATPQGGFVYLWIVVGAFGGFLMPAMQGLMSAATPESEQGELQGAIASVMSVTTVVSPLVMTQVFARFTHDGADPYFPGAPFVVAAVVLAAALIPFRRTMQREGVRRRLAAQHAS
nr:MFS transporter [Parvularcula dongshanensis]